MTTRTAKIRWIGILLAAVSCAVGARLATLAVLESQKAPPTEAVSADKPKPGINIGEVWESPLAAVNATVKNPTSAPLRIESFSTSCACAGTDPVSLDLPPRGEAVIAVRLNTTHRTWAEIGRAKRAVAVQVQPIASGVTLPPIDLHGFVNSRVTLDRLDLHFGDSAVKGQSPVSRAVTAVRHVHGGDIRAKVEPAIASVSVETITSATAKLHVTPDQSLKPGSHAGKLVVEAFDGKAWHYGAEIPVTFELLAARRLFPQLLTLAPKPPGTPVETQLQPPTGVTVESASASGDGWTVAVAANVVTVSTTTPKAGVRTGEITITTRTSGAAPVTHTVQVLVASEGG